MRKILCYFLLTLLPASEIFAQSLPCSSAAGNPWFTHENGKIYLSMNPLGQLSGNWEETICANNNFSASGSYDLNSGNLVVYMSNPQPGQKGLCNALAHFVTYSGSVTNRSCNRAIGTWSNDLGASGEWHWIKNCVVPATESTIDSAQWADAESYPTLHKWVGVLPSSPSEDYNGRNVEERPLLGGSDSCWFEGSAYAPSTNVTGGAWAVGQLGTNRYGHDFVGWVPNAVSYYRSAGRAPCQTSFNQQMIIYCFERELQDDGVIRLVEELRNYKVNVLTAGITASEVTSSRDGISSTRVWP